MSGLAGDLNIATAIIGLIELAGQVGTELYLKLKSIGELSADEQANIHHAIIDALALDDDTRMRIATWRASVGLTPGTPPETPKAGSD